MRGDIKAFPNYEFKRGKDGRMHNLYRGFDVGFGGFVYAEPGMYSNVALLDIASLHPTSITVMHAFGSYTNRFNEIKDARLAIKHGEIDKAAEMMAGKLKPYLEDDTTLTDLAYALKIVINSIYGFTSAKFVNPFRGKKNVNNIVALRGALAMIDIMLAVQRKGFTVAHIKTDSIKIPDATPEIIKFVMDMGKDYGYTFEHEATYEKMCLVNDAVYIAKYDKAKTDKKTGKEIWWEAVGKQFQVPYVFKTLFSKEKVEFEDLCEAKSVTTALYLDMNEGLAQDEHSYQFIGKVGNFCPIKPGCGGGELMRKATNGKYAYATGCKGYRWLEAENVNGLGGIQIIDTNYFRAQVDEAIGTISQYGDFEWFAG